MLIIVPVSFQNACEFIRKHHRHHKAPVGHKFSIAVSNGKKVVGVAIVGRPVARRLDNGWVLEVTRLCTDGTKNACSILYAACWRAARAMGFLQLVTYTLDTEQGISLRAAGWFCLGKAGGKSWNVPSRPRTNMLPEQLKIKWTIQTLSKSK